MSDILETIKQDYQNFPKNQTYTIYAKNVYFQDPLNEFTGIQRYQKMIAFMGNWFQNIDLELHNISQENEIIHTKWTLHWTTPLPWQPRIAIPGRSELKVSPDQIIISHIDYWDCSRLNVLKQHFRFS